jgi:hypothetical protein
MSLSFLFSPLFQLRSSFTKAFSRNAKVTKVQCQSEGENERQHSPPPPAPTDAGQEVAELQKQLREKDLVLTDIRLEALSSAHQLESLKDTVMKMRVSSRDEIVFRSSEMLILAERNAQSEAEQREVATHGQWGDEHTQRTSRHQEYQQHRRPQ